MANSDHSGAPVVLITGVSSGIGHALAEGYLHRGYRVCGLSRRTPPASIIRHPRMFFRAVDLVDFDSIHTGVEGFSEELDGSDFDTLFLNAGSFGSVPARAETVTMTEFMDIMKLNVGAVKATLDACLNRGFRPRKAVASASISSVRPRAGMVSYATSKAALNALVHLYHLENPDIFFLALGLCNVSTRVAQTITQAGPELPELFELARRAELPGYVVTPAERVRHIMSILDQIEPLGLEPGQFYEVRQLLSSLAFTSNTLTIPPHQAI